jgi:hypothetical protein
LLILGAFDGLTDEVLAGFAAVDFLAEEVLDFCVDLPLCLVVEVDFFLVLEEVEPELSVVVCARLCVTGKASDTHNKGASQARRNETNDKKRIPVALENIKTM